MITLQSGSFYSQLRRELQAENVIGRLLGFTLTIAILFSSARTADAVGLTGFNWVHEFSGVQGNTSGGFIEYTINPSLAAGTALSTAQWTSELVAAMGQWTFASSVDFQEDGLFTDNDITFTGLDLNNLGINAFAITCSPDCSALPGNSWNAGPGPTLSTVEIAFDTSRTWSALGTGTTLPDAGAVALHEIGHAIGLAHIEPNGLATEAGGSYRNARTTGGFHNPAPVIMNKAAATISTINGATLHEDDIAGVRYIYGSDDGSSLQNAAFGTNTGTGVWTQMTLPHHPIQGAAGSEGATAGNVWNYTGTISDSGFTVIIDSGANHGVSAASAPIGWATAIGAIETRFIPPIDYGGNFEVSLTSTNLEEARTWSIGSSSGMTFGPGLIVPEPSTALLLVLGSLLMTRITSEQIGC